MKFLDLIKISQRNLTRAKLRTALTVGAVFIGVLTISLTNGVGSGIRSYVDTQLGNIGVEHTLFVQAKQSQQNPVQTDVKVYDPDQKIGNFNVAFLGPDDVTKVTSTAGIRNVTPLRDAHIEYVTRGGEKYSATATQYVQGLNITMASGTTIAPGQISQISIPIRYIAPLGFASPADAVGKTVTLGFKDVNGTLLERAVVIAGVQSQSILGGADINISSEMAQELYDLQTQGVSGLSNRYIGLLATYDPSLSTEQVDSLKTTLSDLHYSAKTFEEQVGIISQVINAVLLVLNIFGVIALVAATFGIVNTLLMSVNERTSEIGLMKALGANQRTVFAIFATEAASIGFWGGLLGIAVSIGVGALANHIAADTFIKDLVGLQIISFPVLSTLATLAGVIVLAFLAGALPALKASRMDPINALRYE